MLGEVLVDAAAIADKSYEFLASNKEGRYGRSDDG